VANGDHPTQNLSVILRARYGVIGIRSREERRVERAIYAIAAAGRDPSDLIFWSCTKGFTKLGEAGEELVHMSTDAEASLDWIIGDARRAVYVLRDFHPFFKVGDTPWRVIRRMRELVKEIRRTRGAEAKSVILLSPTLDLPEELKSEIHMETWPLPDRAELETVLTATISGIQDPQASQAAGAANREALVVAMAGLSIDEAHGALARSLAAKRTLDPAVVLTEKKQIIESVGALEWMDPLPGGLDAVGDLDEIKAFLASRHGAFSHEAGRYGRKGLPQPRGVFMCGVPGSGKTLLAKAVATAWEMTPLRFNVAALFGKYVGESETNLRTCLEIIRAVAPCVLLIDEIDKAIRGGSSINETDNRVKGELLTFLQDRKSREPIFVMASANNVEQMAEASPEMLRKGRWDELFFFDLPTQRGRKAIITVQCQQLGIDLVTEAIERIAEATLKFSGAEIEAVLIEAMYAGFHAGGRPVTVADVLHAVRRTKPLAVTAKGRIESLRRWADGTCTWASRREVGAAAGAETRHVEL
jgi:hypothetical protein